MTSTKWVAMEDESDHQEALDRLCRHCGVAIRDHYSTPFVMAGKLPTAKKVEWLACEDV